MVLPPNPPQDPYYNINYLTKLNLAQLQALYTLLAQTVLVSARPADLVGSTSVTLTVSDSGQYGNGYLIKGSQLKIFGDAYVIAIPDSTSITIQYTYQVFPEIPNGTYLSFVPPIGKIVTTVDNYQYKSRQWLIAQLTGQVLSALQIENEFSFPGVFKISDYIGLAAQISIKPIRFSDFYGITNDYFPYEVDPINVPISTTQSLPEFIGGPSSSLSLLQAGWVPGNTIPTAIQSAYTNCVGTAIIDSVELRIGGQLIEVITGEYIQNYMDMTTELQNKPALTILYGKDDYSAITNNRTYIINLPFYFYRETGLALPLVSLYRQDVELYFKFNNFGRNYNIGADYSQFSMTPTSNNITVGSIEKSFDRTTLSLSGGIYTGTVYNDMELLIDLSAFGIDSNAVTVIDSAYPITIDGTNYTDPVIYNPLLPTATDVQLWVRFSPVKTKYYGGSFGKPLLFVFPLLQPNNIQPYVINTNNFINATVIGEYAYLTGPELNFFKTRKLTYLIAQLQVSKNRLAKGSVGGYFELKFINPVVMLQIFIRNDRTINANKVYLNKNVDLFDYSQNGLLNMGLYFNGQEAFTTAATDAVYLGALEVLDKRTAPAYAGSKVTSNIFMYSFSLKPEVLSNPSGHVNFSRIKQQVLEINMSPDPFYEKQLDIYAINYNILRVEHGLAGLLFNSSQ